MPKDARYYNGAQRLATDHFTRIDVSVAAANPGAGDWFRISAIRASGRFG